MVNCLLHVNRKSIPTLFNGNPIVKYPGCLSIIMSPQPNGGDILFLVRIPSASASASASALLRFRMLSFEPMDGFLPNLHRYTVGMAERVN